MKVTFKSYEDLKALAQASNNLPTPSQWDKTIKIGEGFDENIDWFLKQIAGKTFECSGYEVSGGGKIMEFFTIQTAAVGQDGGFNTNSVFGEFKVSKEWLDNVDYEGKTYWTCINCGFTVTPDEKYPFDIKKTFGDIGVDDCACPYCFTKTMKAVNS